MTPAQPAVVWAAVHAEAFDRAWDVTTFERLLDQPGVSAIGDANGFVLLRTVVDEAEILTLAVGPSVRRQGRGLALTRAAAEKARAAGARKLHLEVAEDNIEARALYERAGFTEVGRRPRYYGRTDGPDAAAILLSLNLA